MAFVVDSQEWSFNGWTSADVQSAIEDMLKRFDRAFELQQDVWVGDELQTQLVYDVHDLWSLRGDCSDIKIEEEVWQELAAALGRTKRYIDEERWPPGFDDFAISVEGEPSTVNPDIAWAHHNVRDGHAVACLGIKRRGRLLTTSACGTERIHWVDDEKSFTLFWREAIHVERNSAATLERLAPFAYPGLHFVPTVWRGLAKLSGGYYAHSVELQRYLAVLSDNGYWAFMAPPPAEVTSEARGASNESPTSQLVIRRFNRLGLTVTPENPDVFRNRECREARERVVDGNTLYFEWHGKLQPYQNRIHIHPPLEAEGKVLIGIIDAHLPLP